MIKHNERQLIEKIIKEYIDFTTVAIEVTKNGLRIKDDIARLADAFQQRLFDYHYSNLPFMNRLLAHFQPVSPKDKTPFSKS